MKCYEDVAKGILIELGYDPKPIYANSHYPQNKGMPDFQCTDELFVEIKYEKISVEGSQLKTFSRLIKEGKTVIIMLLHKDLTHTFYSIDVNLVKLEGLFFNTFKGMC